MLDLSIFRGHPSLEDVDLTAMTPDEDCYLSEMSKRKKWPSKPYPLHKPLALLEMPRVRRVRIRASRKGLATSMKGYEHTNPRVTFITEALDE